MHTTPRGRGAIAYGVVILLLVAWVAALLDRIPRPAELVTPLDDGRVLVRAHGYRDDITLAARVGSGGFSDLELRSSRETPMYAPEQAIRRYLERLDGVAADRLAEVDGISGATVTTDAIRYALAAAAPGTASLVRPAVTTALWALATVLVLAPISRKARRVALATLSAGAFVTVGVMWNSPVTLASLASPRAVAAWAPVLAVASSALIRNVYCRNLCPMGTLERLAAAGGRRLSRRRTSPPGLLAALRPGRYVLLGVGVLSLLLGNELYLEPYAFLFSRRPAFWLYLLPAAALALSLAGRRVWCQALCPLGAALDLVAALRGRIAHALSPRRGRSDAAQPAARGPGAPPVPAAAPVAAVAVAAALFGLILVSNLLVFLGAWR